MSKSPQAPLLAALLFAAAVMSACSQTPHGSDTATGRAEFGDELAHGKNATTGLSCIDCHGAEGNAPIDPTFPKLGGQYDDYLVHALHAYRDGDRQHPLMRAQAARLSDQDIADLAAYFASRPSQLSDLRQVR